MCVGVSECRMHKRAASKNKNTRMHSVSLFGTHTHRVIMRGEDGFMMPLPTDITDNCYCSILLIQSNKDIPQGIRKKKYEKTSENPIQGQFSGSKSDIRQVPLITCSHLFPVLLQMILLSLAALLFLLMPFSARPDRAEPNTASWHQRTHPAISGNTEIQ